MINDQILVLIAIQNIKNDMCLREWNIGYKLTAKKNRAKSDLMSPSFIIGLFHTTVNTKGKKENAKFLIPGNKTSPDITILLCIKIMLNVFSIGNTFVFCHFAPLWKISAIF